MIKFKFTKGHKIVILICLVLIISLLRVFMQEVNASSQTFSYTGAQQTWVVPAGVTSVTVDVAGAAAGSGKGGRVQTIISTTPGETLYFYVGGAPSGGTGGYNGGGGSGGSGSGGGGGASDVRQGGTALANRVVVAGGGGNDGGNTGKGTGGHGGNTSGAAGTGAGAGGNGGGGGGGTSASGGGAGTCSNCTGQSSAGALGVGGGGGAQSSCTSDGGGGGGGYYGGGGGGGGGCVSGDGGGGGGGGSSYSSGSNTTHTQGYQSGNGQINIIYNNTVPSIPSLDLPADTATNQSLTPIFKTTTTDAENDNLQYKIQICTDSGMTTNCQTFDQSSSQTGWSGQNAQSSTSYSSGTQAVYTVQSALSAATTYYWRSYATDQVYGAGWSSTQTTPRSFTTGSSCNPSATTTFSYTGAQQTWVVPAGITSVNVDAQGAQGQAGQNGQAGGAGGRIQTTITTTPAETLYIYVGDGGGTTYLGGYNGGGNGGTGGGDGGGGSGASDIRQGGTALGNRVVVAGGGGGGGGSTTTSVGGVGGGTTGGTGGNSGGTGGTQSAGGTSGGASGTGGNGGSTSGGAGGGGYYGGGGGASASSGRAGGGGSSYSSGTSTTHTQGYRSGSGQIIITYNTCTAPSTPSLDLPADAATYQTLTPVLETTASDSEGNDVKYKIQICTDSGMTANCQTFDQSSSQTGWSGQNTVAGTAYTSGTQGVYTIQSALNNNTTYYWRSYAIDPSGSNTWSATQTPRSFTTKPGSCGEPISGSYTIGTSCIFTGTINGVDAGTGNTNTAQLQIGTAGTPGSLTIWSDQTIAAGSIKIVNGSIILWGTPGQRGQIKIRTPLYLPDADGDGFPTSVTTTKYTTGGAGRVRQSAVPDCNDSNNAIYPGTCNGTTACTSAGVTQACSTAGICQTGGGCSAGSCTAVNNVPSGQDTNNDCTASYNSCSGNNKVGPDGNCNGAGACNTGGLSYACPTAGTCQTGGGCSSGSCVAVSNASAGTDPGNDCTASYNACSGTNKIGPDGNCDGAGACNTGGLSYACPFTGCHNGCSGGACVEVPNGSDYNGACTRPAGYSVYTVYPGGGTCNSACSSHTTTGDNCNGSGSCQTPSMSCYGIGTDGSATNGSYALYNTVTAPSTCSTWVATGGGGCGTSMTAGNCQGCSGSGCPKQTNCKCN